MELGLRSSNERQTCHSTSYSRAATKYRSSRVQRRAQHRARLLPNSLPLHLHLQLPCTRSQQWLTPLPKPVSISRPNLTITYRETFTQPLDNLTRRLSTASSNHGPRATTAELENGASNGRKKSRLLPKQHSPAQFKWNKPDINKKSRLQEATRDREEETQDEWFQLQTLITLALLIFPCIIPATRMPVHYPHECLRTTHVDAYTFITRTNSIPRAHGRMLSLFLRAWTVLTLHGRVIRGRIPSLSLRAWTY
ncbi:hypothetical protein K503DRAFT_478601 [Rhizopogon vinicolor AM-OR11-026]|uniref:Uncharacterized protein n=1 Tax=Rhizopogon vinicolor AM-OR11-026 TaxID=1314800 RepID=A0A1B7MN09_9AGAM|nr:hypothetical protein K503DRAFT_478601 [Rhizopogon vinicolor AM-OR11-026]